MHDNVAPDKIKRFLSYWDTYVGGGVHTPFPALLITYYFIYGGPRDQMLGASRVCGAVNCECLPTFCLPPRVVKWGRPSFYNFPKRLFFLNDRLLAMHWTKVENPESLTKYVVPSLVPALTVIITLRIASQT